MSAYWSHAFIKRKLKKVSKINTWAWILSLDIGRQFIGSAISTDDFTKAEPLKIDPQWNYQRYDYSLNEKFYKDLNKVIWNKKIKALVVGYPLD
jgi:RNase H-fold protein (predicted Holliday junction resolvase)